MIQGLTNMHPPRTFTNWKVQMTISYRFVLSMVEESEYAVCLYVAIRGVRMLFTKTSRDVGMVTPSYQVAAWKNQPVERV